MRWFRLGYSLHIYISDAMDEIIIHALGTEPKRQFMNYEICIVSHA